jgi:hypothetical protein
MLLLPSTASVRAIETPSNPNSTDPPRTVANWGVIGPGIPTLFVDSKQCSKPLVNNSANVTTAPLESKYTFATAKNRPPMWLWVSVLVCSVLAITISIGTRYVNRTRSAIRAQSQKYFY